MQFEFPFVLGPQPGRYTIRERLGEAPGQVLVLSALGACERRLADGRRRRRRAIAAAPQPPPTPVYTMRATLVDAAALADATAAACWLREADLDALAEVAVVRLNRALHAHRVAAADPYAREVARAQSLVTRVGFGAGEQVSEGRWEQARELPPAAPAAPAAPARRPRPAAMRSQERLAALLVGRDAALACEELALRARQDVDAGRWREAALQLRVVFDAALAELEPWADQIGGLAARLDELRDRHPAIGAVAGAALQGGLDDVQIALVASSLGRVEAALRARAAGVAGLY